jgi:hypothetical protein
MSGELLLIIILTLPLLLGVIFKASASHIFFGVMAGELLGRYFGHDIDGMFTGQLDQPALAGYGETLLIVLPMVLTAYFMRRSIKPHKLMFHIWPLAATGIILAAFVLPVLPPEIQTAATEHPVGDWLLHINRAIVGGVIILQLLSLWIFTRDKERRRKAKEKP